MKENLTGRYLSVEECSELLGVPKSWLYERTRRKKIPHLKLGKYIRFNMEELTTWLEDQRRGTR